MDELLQRIEEKRLAFINIYKKYNSINIALMVIFIIAFIPVMVWIMPIPEYGTYISLGIILVFVVILFIYGNFMKKKTSTVTMAYIDDYCKLIDQYVFSSEEVEDYYQFTDEQIDLKVVQDARFVKDVTDVASRNTVKYRIGKTSFSSADLVAYTRETVKRRTMKRGLFYGKLLVADNQQSSEERTLIYLKPKANLPALPAGPNDIEGLDKKHDDQDFALYSSSGKVDKVLTKQAVNFLAKFPVNENIVDVAISIQKGKTYFALSLSEPLMNIPYKTNVNQEAIEQLQGVIKACEKFLKLQTKG